MSSVPLTIRLVIPANAPQEEIWELEKDLGEVKGVTTDLQEARDPVAAALLFLTIVGTVAANVKSIYDIAKLLYDFGHSKKQHYDLTIRKGETSIELKNLKPEEIAKILSEE